MSKALSNQLKLLRKSRSALAAGDLEEYERLNAEADNEVEEGLEEEEVSTEPADIEPVVEEVSSEEVPSSFPPAEPSSTTPTPLEPIPEVLQKGEIPGAGSPTWVELSEMRGEGAFGTAFAHLQDFVLENAREGGIRAATPLKDRKLESTLGSVENVGIAGALSSAGHPYLAAAAAVAGLYPAALTLSNEVLGTNFGEGGTGFGGDPLDPTQWLGGVVLPRTTAQDIQDNKDRKILKTFPKNSPEARAARERLKVTELSDIIASVVQLNNPGEVASGYTNDRAYEADFLNAAGQMGESAHKVETLKMGLDLASANEAIKDRFSGVLKRDEIKDLYYQTDWTGRGRESGVNISGPIEQLTAVTMDKIRRENPGISAEELRARADKHVETEVQLALQNHPFAEGIAIINIGDADALKELYEMEDRWGAAYGELGRVAAQTLAPIYASMTPVPMTQRMGLMSPEQVYGQSSLVSGLRLANLAPTTWWAAGSKFDKYPVVGPLLSKLGLIDPEDAVLSPEDLAWMMEGGDVIDAAPHAVSALFDHIYPDAAPGSDEWNAMTAQMQKDHPFLTQAPIIAAAMFKEPDALSMMFAGAGKFSKLATLSAKSIKFKKYIENIDENILPRLEEIAARLEPYSVKSTDAKGTATYTHKDVPIELEDELGQAIQALTDSALKAAGDDPELQAFFQTNLLGRLKGSTGEAVRANWQTSVKARRALSELKGKNVKGVDDALKAAGHELRALEAGAQAADGILDISTTKLRMVVEAFRDVMPEFFEAEGLNVAAVKNLSRKRLQKQLENATRDTLEQAEAIETLKHNNSEAWATGASMFARLQEKKALLEQAVDIAKRGLAVGDEVEVFTGVALDAGKFIEYKDVDGVKRAFIRIETENGSVVKHFDIKDVAFDFHGLVNKLNPAHGAPWSAVGKRFRDLAKAAFFKETEGAFKAADGSIWVPAKGLDSLKEGQTVRWLDGGELKSVEEMTVKTKGTLEDGTDTATIFTGKAKKPSMVVTVPLDQVFTLRHRDAEEQLDGILAILEARARAATMHRGEKVTEEAINAWYARNFKGFATDLKGEVKPLVAGDDVAAQGDLFDDIMYQGPATAGAATAEEAVEAARLWKELGTESPYFKKWFGDSKIVGEDGKPLKVYHGAPDMRFATGEGGFKTPAERFGMGEDTRAHWFASSKATARTYADDRRAFDYQAAEPGIVEVYIKLKNPLVIEGAGKRWRDAQKRGKTGDVLAEAREKGHDGVIIRNVRDDYGIDDPQRITDTYAVFDNTNIKSTANRGTFDETGRILYQGADEVLESLSSEDLPRALEGYQQLYRDLPEDAKAASVLLRERWVEFAGSKASVLTPGYGADVTVSGGARALRRTEKSVLNGRALPVQLDLLRLLQENPEAAKKATPTNYPSLKGYSILRPLRDATVYMGQAVLDARKTGSAQTLAEVFAGKGQARNWSLEAYLKNMREVRNAIAASGLKYELQDLMPTPQVLATGLFKEFTDALATAARRGEPTPEVPNFTKFISRISMPKKAGGYEDFGAGTAEDFTRRVITVDPKITLEELFKGVPVVKLDEPEDIVRGFKRSPKGTPDHKLQWYERAANRKRGRGQTLRQIRDTRKKLSKAAETDPDIATISDAEYDVIKQFVAMVGTKRLEDVAFAIEPTIRRGFMLSEPLGLYAFGEDVLGISHSAIARGRFVDTTIHELWHGLSQYLPDNTVSDLYKQFARERDGFMKKNPEAFSRDGELNTITFAQGQGTYRFSSFDEWVVEKMKDLSIEEATMRTTRKLSDPMDVPYKHAWQRALKALSELVMSHYAQIKAAFGRDVARQTYADFMSGMYMDKVRSSPLVDAVKIPKAQMDASKQRWDAYLDALDSGVGVDEAAEAMSSGVENLIREMAVSSPTIQAQGTKALKSDAPASVDDIVKVLFQEGDEGAKAGREALFAPEYEARGRIAFNPKLHPKPDDLIVVEHTTETKYLDLFMAEGIDATIRPPTSGMGRLTVQPDGSVRQSYIKDSGLYVAPADSLSSSQRVVIVTPAKSVELSLESKGLGYESGIAGLYGAKDAIMRGKIPAENVAGKMIYDWSDKEWKWIPNPNSPYRDRFEVDGPKLVTKAADLLRQGEEESAKAAVQFVEDNKAILYAFEQADVSSLLHEIGHVFRRDLLRSGWQGKLDSDVLVRAFTTKDERHIGDTVTFDGGEGVGWTDLTKAGKTRTPEEMDKIQGKRSRKRKAAIDKRAKGLEAQSGPATWTVKSEERFARAFEKYLATGRSPSLELDGVFKKFKSWMTEIYVQVRGSAIGRDIPKEVREVFDRMLTGAMTTEGYMKTFTKNQMMSMLDSKGIVYKSKELKESLAKKLSAADLNRTAEYRRFIKRQDDMAKQAAELAKLKTSTVATRLAPAEAKLVKSLEEELEPLHKKNNDARTALLKAKEKLDNAMSRSTTARRKLILRNVYDEQKSGEKVVLSTQNALIKFRGNPTAKAADHLAEQLVRIEAGNKKIAGNNLLSGVEGAIKDLKVMVEILKKEQMVRPARRNLMTHPMLKSVIRDRGKGTWIIDPKEFVDSVDKFYVSGVLEEFLATPEGLFLSPIVKAAQQGNTKLTYTKAQMNRLQKTLKAMEGQYRAGELSQASMGAFLQMQRSYKNPRAKSIRVPVPFSDMVGGKGVLLNVPGSATRRFWHFYNVFDPTYSKLGQISPKIAKIASKQTRFVEHGLGDMHNLNMTHMGEDFLGAHVRYMDSTEAIKGRYGSTTVNTLGRGIFKEAQNFIRSNIQLTKKGRATFTEDAAGQYTKSLVNALERTFLNKPELKLQPRVSEAQATKLRPKVLELLSDENMTYDKFLRELGKAAGRSEFGRQDARGIMMSSRALLDAAAQQHTLRAMANTTSAMLTSEEALTMTRFMEGEMDKASDVDLLWSAAAKLGMDLSEGTIRAGTKHGQGEKARIKSLVRWNLDDGRSLTPEELVEHNTKLTATLKEKGVSPEDIKAQLIVSGQKITDPRQVFMPSQIGDAMRDSNRSFVKELDQYYSNPKGFDPQARIAKFVRYWKGMITSGLGLPRPKYYVNNILGDFSQMWQNHGIFTAGKVSAQNTLSNIPYIGPSIQNVTSKMAQKFEGIPILSTAVESVFNPQIGRIFTGEEGVAKFWDGDVSLSTLRENLALDGVLDTFTSREVSVNANQVAMELLGDAEKKYGKSIPDKFKSRVARRLKHDVDGFAVQVQQRQRVGLYLELRKQGLDHDGAVKGVKDALYDWSQGFSSWEQSWQMGIVIPFYRFWRLAAGQMIRAFMEPFVMDSSEYMLKALTGQTQLARMKNQGRALSGIPKWAAYAEAEEAPNGEEDEVFWDGILAKPWWIRPGMTYAGKQATQRQKDFMLQDHGREIDTIATAMSAPMTAAEMYTIGTYILTTPFAAFAAAMDEDKKFNGLRAQKQLEKFAVDIGGPFVEALLKEKRTSKTGYRRISPGQESALKLLGDAADVHRDEEGRLVADEKALLFINNLPVIGSQWADGVNGMEWSKLHYEDEDLFNRILYMLGHISGPVRDYASSTDATLSFAHKDVIEKIKTAADKQKVGDDPKEVYKRMNE